MHFDGSDDPLDVAASQQRSNRGSSFNDMVIPKLKKNGKGRKKEVDMVRSVVGQQKSWAWGTGSSVGKLQKQREEQAAAALKRKAQNDGLGNDSSGEKRKRSDSAIDVDDDDIMGTLAAVSNQRGGKSRNKTGLPSLDISRAAQGREGDKYLSDATSELDHILSKPIPKKKRSKSKPKSKSQGGQFDSSEDKCKSKSAQASSHLFNLTILHTPPSYRR